MEGTLQPISFPAMGRDTFQLQAPSDLSWSRGVNFPEARRNLEDNAQGDSHAEDGPVSNATDADAALAPDSDE